MSVIVKGMKMPDSCAVCKFAGRGGYFMERIVCMFTGKNEDAKNVDRLSDCPLVALPDHHGRLVEFIDVVTTLDEDSGTEEVCLGDIMRAYYEMRNAPTIVEAEDSEYENSDMDHSDL